MRSLITAAVLTSPAPVSSSSARSCPKIRYKNGFSKWMHPDSRRMKKFGLYSWISHGGMDVQSGPPVRQLAGSVPASNEGTFEGRKRHTLLKRPFESQTDP